MRLHQFLHEVAATSRLLDASGRTWQWPADELVRVASPEQAGADETVLVVADLAADRADDEASRLHALPEGCAVVILVEPEPDHLPVGAVVDLLVAGGIQAVQAAPVSADSLGTAILGRRSIGDVASISPYLDPRREISLTPGATLLRVRAEHVVEGVAWRALEVSNRQAMWAAERDRDNARTMATAAKQQLADYRLSAERQEADVRARLAAAEGRLQDVLNSRSYRLARALGAPARLVKALLTAR
jgi:hypothetical protein